MNNKNLKVTISYWGREFYVEVSPDMYKEMLKGNHFMGFVEGIHEKVKQLGFPAKPIDLSSNEIDNSGMQDTIIVV